jgi:hypothetical protein
MNLEAVNIQADSGEQESLALALRAVARTAGEDLDYDEACAALGISFVAIAGPAESSPTFWPTFGRDTFLTPTARLFGIHLRDLHPPEVGVDMLWAEEFPQHFDLSYKPLILRSLENDQPVFAWGLWEKGEIPRWGVITNAEGAHLIGFVPGASSPVRLSRAALQCYVVEQYEPRQPSAEELLAAAMEHAQGLLSRPAPRPQNVAPGESRIVTGPAAYDVWATWLQAQRPGSEEDPAREAFQVYTSALCDARASAGRYLSRSDAVHDPNHGAIMDGAMNACETFSAELSLLCRAAEVQALWSTAEGHQELLENIRTAQKIDLQIADYVRQLASTA